MSIIVSIDFSVHLYYTTQAFYFLYTSSHQNFLHGKLYSSNIFCFVLIQDWQKSVNFQILPKIHIYQIHDFELWISIRQPNNIHDHYLSATQVLHNPAETPVVNQCATTTSFLSSCPLATILVKFLFCSTITIFAPSIWFTSLPPSTYFQEPPFIELYDRFHCVFSESSWITLKLNHHC